MYFNIFENIYFTVLTVVFTLIRAIFFNLLHYIEPPIDKERESTGLIKEKRMSVQLPSNVFKITKITDNMIT
jgi:hypothetical protein